MFCYLLLLLLLFFYFRPKHDVLLLFSGDGRWRCQLRCGCCAALALFLLVNLPYASVWPWNEAAWRKLWTAEHVFRCFLGAEDIKNYLDLMQVTQEEAWQITSRPMCFMWFSKMEKRESKKGEEMMTVMMKRISSSYYYSHSYCSTVTILTTVDFTVLVWRL